MTTDAEAFRLKPSAGSVGPTPQAPHDGAPHPEPPVRGERVLAAVDRLITKAERPIGRVLPEAWNPLAQTGAIANTCFLIAVVSGVVLLVWYSPSVHSAHASVVAMDNAPYSAGLVRSLHRYSSDASMAFVLLHAAKLFFARRFGGARWLAWVTGIAATMLLWVIGWLGYWLVWDDRAQEVALGTARLLDVLPIFADPLSRSFLTDDAVSSLLFFVVFFVHMLVPLTMAVALWLHITRLSRPGFLTKLPMTIAVSAVLTALSLALPADTSVAARMGVAPERFAMDAWFLLPLYLTDRLGSGALWAIVVLGGVALFSVPWWVARGRARVVEVLESRCNGCTLCYQDCPYDAVRMVARTDGSRAEPLAVVDPDKCVGCGICVGSCDSAAIGLPWFTAFDKRGRINQWVDEALKAGEAPFFAFVCAKSAGGTLAIDRERGTSPDLPGYRVLEVPCAGWVQPLLVERAFRHGARGVLVAACPPASASYREGGKHTHLRMLAERRPKLRLEKVDPARVRVVDVAAGSPGALRSAAAALRNGKAPEPARPRWQMVAVAAVLAAISGFVTFRASRVAYAAPVSSSPELVVSFKHPGQVESRCRPPSEEELRKAPAHMRPKEICERKRVSVRLEVRVDGELRASRSYQPAGIWRDGNSLAIERMAVPAGEHRVEIRVGDSADPSEFGFRDERVLTFEPRVHRVVLFDKLSGFRWY